MALSSHLFGAIGEEPEDQRTRGRASKQGLTGAQSAVLAREGGPSSPLVLWASCGSPPPRSQVPLLQVIWDSGHQLPRAEKLPRGLEQGELRWLRAQPAISPWLVGSRCDSSRGQSGQSRGARTLPRALASTSRPTPPATRNLRRSLTQSDGALIERLILPYASKPFSTQPHLRKVT
ncbi:hypothetical protein BX600DRAFT_103593 [Xylariales sp. PMI_506]|nr:hypothetical protein BX600DRAFT_103593 [Xylariales sp. PMI_506]